METRIVQSLSLCQSSASGFELLIELPQHGKEVFCESWI